MKPKVIHRANSLLAIVAICLASQFATAGTHRTTDDLAPAIAALLSSDADWAFLVVKIAGTEDFVQMSGYQGTAELDFPQITVRQKALRNRVEAVCEDLGLELTVTRGSDGSEFLDYELPPDEAVIAGMVVRLLRDVFDIGEDAALEFEWHGFELPM